MSIAIWTLCLILNNNAFLPLDAFSSRASESLCAVRNLLPSPPAPLPPCGRGEPRVPPLLQAGEGDTGGEGNKARLPNGARAGRIVTVLRIPRSTAVPLSAPPALLPLRGSGEPIFPSPASERGGYGVRKRSFRLLQKASAPPCAPTPLSHPVGEGLGVRAIKSAHAMHAVNPTDVPDLNEGGAIATLSDEPEIPPATGSLWDDRAGSLYDDFKARRVGDLVTIVVVENTTASARANTAVQKSESASTTAGVGPLLNFLWPELSASGRTESNTQGNTARAGTLQTRITVQVVETFPNGVLRIEGRRTLKINEETQTLVFSGLVRIRDIRADNTVPSTAIANAEIYFEGKGIVGSRQREGILTRLFKIIF